MRPVQQRVFSRRAVGVALPLCLFGLTLGAVAISSGWLTDRGPRTVRFLSTTRGPTAARPTAGRVSRPGGPRVVVDGDTHDFGTMEVGSRGSHEFIVRNEGDAPLRLIKGDTTCRCTLIELAHGWLEPRAACRVRVEWEAAEPAPIFRHGAVLLTNDPHRRQIQLIVTGRVLSPLSASPGEVIFTDVPAGSTRQQRLLIFSQTAELLELADVTSTLPELTWELAPVTSLDLRRAGACSGAALLLTLAAPEGQRRFHGMLQMRVRLVDAKDRSAEHLLELPIAGNVFDGFAIYGPRWDPDGRLRLGNLERSRGVRHTLYISAPPDAQLEVERITVPALKAAVRPLTHGPKGLARFSLLIEVPPGTLPLDCMGENEAIVQLSTGVLSRPTLAVRVQFCVLD